MEHIKDRKALNAYLDKHILKASQQAAADNGETIPQTLPAAASYMWARFWGEVGHYWQGNYQDGFIYWCMGQSLGTIETAADAATDILHGFGFYAKPEQEADAAEFLHAKLSMRVRRLMPNNLYILPMSVDDE